jgi:hypothetical protein
MGEEYPFGTVGHMMQALGKLPKPAPKKMWMGTAPQLCQLCSNPLKKQFVDGKTQMGPWGIMCVSCHKRRGCGLGTGRGQKYDLVTLEKIEG